MPVRRALGRGASLGRSPTRLAGSRAPSENTQSAAAGAVSSQVLQAGALAAERLQEGGRKGQDNGPFVSMETAPQGEGQKEARAPTSPTVRTWEMALLVVGPAPPLPFPARCSPWQPFLQTRGASWQSTWCWGSQGAQQERDWEPPPLPGPILLDFSGGTSSTV